MNTVLNKFFSIIVFSILHIYTGLFVIILLPIAYLKLKTAVSQILEFWAKSTFWVMAKKLTIIGLDNYSRKKKYLIVANHSSMFDIMAIMAVYPNVAWFGHSRLLRIPVFNQILKMINYIPLREKGVRNTKQMLQEIVEKSLKHTIAIFPEGTRTLDGNLNDFYRGFVYVLKSVNVELLPVTLNGFYQLKPKDRWYIDFNAKLEMVIHKPISTTEHKTKSDQEIIKDIKAIIESSLHK